MENMKDEECVNEVTENGVSYTSIHSIPVNHYYLNLRCPFRVMTGWDRQPCKDFPASLHAIGSDLTHHAPRVNGVKETVRGAGWQ